YDFVNTFPTAIVEIDGKQYEVNLDAHGRGTVSVISDGSGDLTARIVEVNGNFEVVNVPVELTLYEGGMSMADNADDAQLHGTRGDDIIIADAGGVATVVQPGKNYNIVLVVDTSGSMSDPSGQTKQE